MSNLNSEDQEKEKNAIIDNLRNIKPVHKYSINLTDNYDVNVINNKVSLKAIQKMILKKIKIDYTSNVSYTVRRTGGKTEKRVR